MLTTFHRSRVTRRRTIASSGLLAAVVMLSLSLVAQADVPTTAAAPRSDVSPAGGLGISKIVGGLNQPVFLTNAGDKRLFVVERAGRIRTLKHKNGTWRVAGTFLDIRSRVYDGDSEQGLLGLAFPPDYADSGRFYVYYVNGSQNEVVAEYRRSQKNHADPSSERKLLTISDPFSNHNGGWMAFTDSDPGRLYIDEGDGGDGGDPGNRAQSKNVLLGKILRINPRDPDGSGPKHYSVPSGNPFVGTKGLDEIFAYGLRNPWRSSFDPLNGDLWVGDVGQEKFEEIDHVASANGVNFGWHKVEGLHNYPSGSLCTSDCKTLPVVEFKHSVSGEDNCSVVGGYVSRRSGAALYGRYVFGDFCSGRIWNIPTSFDNGTLPSPLDTSLSISSFGIGHDLTIYVVDLGGAIYRVTGS